MRPIGTSAAEQRAWNLIARPALAKLHTALQRAARRASLSARSASGDEARKVELGVGSEAEADGVHAAARAASTPRRRRAVGRGKRAGYGTRAAASCLTSALGGPYPDTKVAGIPRIASGAMSSR